MQDVITHLREDMSVTLVSLVLLLGTTTPSGPLYLSCVCKAECMTIYALIDMTLTTTPLSVAVEMVSASVLKILVNISLCNDRTVIHIYKLFW